MKKVSMLLVIVALVFCIPAFSAAQMQGGSGQHMMKGSTMGNNMGMMSQMMADMHEMMESGKMTPAQHKQMMQMMHQMGSLMQQMGGPQGAKMQAQHQEQLQKMQKQVQEMKGQTK